MHAASAVGQLPLPSNAASPPPNRLRYPLALLLLVPCAFYLSFPTTLTPSSILPTTFRHSCSHSPRESFESPLLDLAGASCPKQLDPLDKGDNWDPKEDAEYAAEVISKLQGAVKIVRKSPLASHSSRVDRFVLLQRTESFDDMKHTPAEEPRFSVMADLHKYLEDTFPAIYDKLQVEKVQEYGLLITWKGKDEGKPVVLMARERIRPWFDPPQADSDDRADQDTVPVLAATEKSWTYPPFSAHRDSDDWIWGRGVADCKNTLVAIFSTFDRLLSEGYAPDRTIIASFGYDEEIGGSRSAAYLSKKLEERYGQDGVSLILDEGFTGVDEAYGTKFARFGLAEKGAVNLDLEVFTQGSLVFGS